MTITLTLSRPRAEYIVSKSGLDFTAKIDETVQTYFDDHVGVVIDFVSHHSVEFNMLVMFHLGLFYDPKNDLKALYKPTQFKVDDITNVSM